VNCVRGVKQRTEPDQWRQLPTGGREKWTGGIRAKAQRTDARRIVQRQHIINFVIRLLCENFFADGPLNQDATPTVWSAILYRPKKRCPMLHSTLQGERGRINRKGVVTLKPFGVILERDG